MFRKQLLQVPYGNVFENRRILIVLPVRCQIGAKIFNQQSQLLLFHPAHMIYFDKVLLQK
jgi:hypothetical protein